MGDKSQRCPELVRLLAEPVHQILHLVSGATAHQLMVCPEPGCWIMMPLNQREWQHIGHSAEYTAPGLQDRRPAAPSAPRVGSTARCQLRPTPVAAAKATAAAIMHRHSQVLQMQRNLGRTAQGLPQAVQRHLATAPGSAPHQPAQVHARALLKLKLPQQLPPMLAPKLAPKPPAITPWHGQAPVCTRVNFPRSSFTRRAGGPAAAHWG